MEEVATTWTQDASSLGMLHQAVECGGSELNQDCSRVIGSCCRIRMEGPISQISVSRSLENCLLHKVTTMACTIAFYCYSGPTRATEYCFRQNAPVLAGSSQHLVTQDAAHLQYPFAATRSVNPKLTKTTSSRALSR